jgi:hypothetical protein
MGIPFRKSPEFVSQDFGVSNSSSKAANAIAAAGGGGALPRRSRRAGDAAA